MRRFLEPLEAILGDFNLTRSVAHRPPPPSPGPTRRAGAPPLNQIAPLLGISPAAASSTCAPDRHPAEELGA